MNIHPNEITVSFTCQHCEFWRERDDVGDCRRYPPVYIVEAKGFGWPMTRGVDGCGEYRDRGRV